MAADKPKRAKCARGTTRVENVPLAGGTLFARVKFCTTKRGRVKVMSKKFTRSGSRREGWVARKHRAPPPVAPPRARDYDALEREAMASHANRPPAPYFDPYAY